MIFLLYIYTSSCGMTLWIFFNKYPPYLSILYIFLIKNIVRKVKGGFFFSSYNYYSCNLQHGTFKIIQTEEGLPGHYAITYYLPKKEDSKNGTTRFVFSVSWSHIACWMLPTGSVTKKTNNKKKDLPYTRGKQGWQCRSGTYRMKD
jgi:hypothetical protein